MATKSLGSSFRDPSGFLFRCENTLYRQILPSYQTHYEHLYTSGLYQKLTDDGMLVKHDERPNTLSPDGRAYKIIAPQELPFIAYPYEWCFSQLKDAALHTLALQKIALHHGMILKDASAYNIQFYQGQPILIDTLSFEIQQKGTPWIAYRQFCQHFLAPLLLMARTDIRLGKLLSQFIDGIPLDLASRLLPRSTWFRFPILLHIHLHAKSQKRHASNTKSTQQLQHHKMSPLALLGLIDSLESLVRSISWKTNQTEWGDYYDHTNYSHESAQEKHDVVRQFIQEVAPQSVWDLGANDGTYSRIALEYATHVVSWDIDPVAVEKNYLRVNKEKVSLLPLQLDLTNPSPAIGWAHKERDSLLQRGPVDLVMALALIHHLAISNNLPLEHIAAFLAQCAQHIIIEFVEKQDSQVQRLLATRKDIFDDYHEDGFREAFSKHFTFLKSVPLPSSHRTLFLLQKKTS